MEHESWWRQSSYQFVTFISDPKHIGITAAISISEHIQTKIYMQAFFMNGLSQTVKSWFLFSVWTPRTLLYLTFLQSCWRENTSVMLCSCDTTSSLCHMAITFSFLLVCVCVRERGNHWTAFCQLVLSWAAGLIPVSADDHHWIREAVRSEEGHERDLQGEVSSHQADAKQDKKVLGSVLSERIHDSLFQWKNTKLWHLLSDSLKREMRAVSEECGLQPVTIAMAFVYFEKLVLQGRLNKQNRKLVAAACVLLAAKISSDLRKPEVKQLIDVSKKANGTRCFKEFWLNRNGKTLKASPQRNKIK